MRTTFFDQDLITCISITRLVLCIVRFYLFPSEIQNLEVGFTSVRDVVHDAIGEFV